MPKPTPLSSSLVATPAVTPLASTPARVAAPQPEPALVQAVDPTIPLQLRLPRSAIRAIKKAALENEETISDYMLACFHARMQNSR